MEIRCVKGMYRLKLVSCENNSGFKGLTGSQSGFRPGYSAQDLVLRVVDDWRGYLDDDEIVGSLFIDLTKAFDSIDHQLMLLKL